MKITEGSDRVIGGTLPTEAAKPESASEQQHWQAQSFTLIFCPDPSPPPCLKNFCDRWSGWIIG
jgi:hypothetical protein